MRLPPAEYSVNTHRGREPGPEERACATERLAFEQRVDQNHARDIGRVVSSKKANEGSMAGEKMKGFKIQ